MPAANIMAGGGSYLETIQCVARWQCLAAVSRRMLPGGWQQLMQLACGHVSSSAYVMYQYIKAYGLNIMAVMCENGGVITSVNNGAHRRNGGINGDRSWL
jgi:hypothetical protein